jgi:hypothetical protein
MATASRLKLGPRDHGRRYSYDDFAAADWGEGHQYELIDGKLYVSPQPNLPFARLDKWIYEAVSRYHGERPEILNFVYYKARVFVPGRRGITCLEPDVSAYSDFPLDRDLRQVRWQDVSPVLVVETLSPDNLDKDLVRNVELYLQVPPSANTGSWMGCRTLNSHRCGSNVAVAAAGAPSRCPSARPTPPSCCPGSSWSSTRGGDRA